MCEIYMLLWVCRPVCRCAYTCGEAVFQNYSPPSFLRQGLSLHLARLAANEPQVSTGLLVPLAPGIQMPAVTAPSFKWVLGSGFRFSWSYSTHCNNWASPQPWHLSSAGQQCSFLMDLVISGKGKLKQPPYWKFSGRHKTGLLSLVRDD